jgi:hypothetical protein
VADRLTHQSRFPLTADMSGLLAATRQDRAEPIRRSPLGRLRTLLVEVWLSRIERSIRRLEKEERRSALDPAPRVKSLRAGRLRLLELR